MPPAGFKRSRALWEQTRLLYYHSSNNNDNDDDGNNNNNSSKKNTKWDYYKALGRAILYELQPVHNFGPQLVDLAWGLVVWFRCNNTLTVASLREQAYQHMQTARGMVRPVIIFVKERTWQQWMWILALFVYYWIVRWIHEWLHAGPVVLIVTLLCIICTIGLGDDEDVDNENGMKLSAYSVFNRGLVRLLGDIRVEDLLAQHVGGGMGMMMMAEGNDVDDDDDGQDAAVFLEQQREQEQARRPVVAAAAAVAPAPPNNNNPQQPDQPIRRRLPGKKARRQQRLQNQQQQQAAGAAAFLGDDEDDEDLDDAALQQILHEQLRLQQQQ